MTARPAPDQRELLITRDFAAPRELVFKAWTEPEQLKRWYAPEGCVITFCTVDLRVGGALHHCLRTPTGYECSCRGIYREIVAPERIVHTLHFADAAGNFREPAEVGADPEWPREMLVTVTFAEIAGGTRLTLHQTVLESLARRTGAFPSWLQMLDRLATELKLARPG